MAADATAKPQNAPARLPLQVLLPLEPHKVLERSFVLGSARLPDTATTATSLLDAPSLACDINSLFAAVPRTEVSVTVSRTSTAAATVSMNRGIDIDLMC